MTPSVNRSTGTPTRHDLWFLPLGGTGEIGLNMNLYGHDGQWLMVDCGLGFDEKNGRERYVPDISFIKPQTDLLQAIVITHGHEDHIGAIAELWPELKAPIFASPFATELILNKLSSLPWAQQVPIYTIHFQQRIAIGEFNVTWLPMTHSIPEASALLIETEVGNVLHTGDWKIDAQPVIGKPFCQSCFSELKALPVDVMVADSTNATKTESSVSESAVYPGLLKTVQAQTGRVVVTCFSSNVARLITLAKVAKKTKRRCAVFGRSMENMVSVARRLGYWPADLELVDPKHIGYLPRDEVLVIATGSQAEPRSAMQKLANGYHPWLFIEADDTVIYSAIKIPPNKSNIDEQIERFKGLGVKVLHADEVKSETGVILHASGHPCQEDLKQLYDWVQPNMLIPTHGEAEHLLAHEQLAKQAGIAKTLAGQNGDLFKLAPFENKVPNWARIGKRKV